MNEQENIKLVKQVYNNFTEGNIDGILNLLCEDVEWKEPPQGPSIFSGMYMGKKQVGDFFTKMSEVSHPITFEPNEYITKGDTVVVLGNYKFHSKVTERDWETDFVMVFRIENNKVKTFQIFKDSAAELYALKEVLHV